MRTWNTQDKSDWPVGEWMSEPDKSQWVDGATGFDCLIVRNHGGALCGYVGVPPEHPAHGKSYNDIDAEVHGGLTFADRCREHNLADFTRWEASMFRRKTEAVQFPQGDSAQAWKETGHLLGNYKAWCEHMQSTSICHVPEPGRPADVWWLGFDCSHAWDVSPGYAALLGNLGSSFMSGSYKNIDYVKHEIGSLCVQLVKMYPDKKR